MKVPISGRVKTSSIASMARRMSVAFFLLEPKAGAKIRSIDDSESGDDVLRVAAPVGVGALDRDLALDDVAVEEGPELLGQVLLDAQGDVVEVDQEGGVRGVHWRLAQVPCRPNQRSVHVCARFRAPRTRATPSTRLAGPGSAAGQRGEREVGNPQGSSARRPRRGTVGSTAARGVGRVAVAREQERSGSGQPEEFMRGAGAAGRGRTAQPNWASPASGRSSTK